MVPKMRVSAYSVAEDWIMGEYVKTYEYSAPNHNGQPWMARFTGCCRSSKLVNNKDISWSISATIDLSLASKSPRAHSLPVISVPRTAPRFFVPADDNTPGAVSWKVATPFDVGNAVQFDGVSSFLGVSLAQHYAAFNTRSCGTNGLVSGPACLFQTLRTFAEPAALTVEGWVWSSQAAGGYVVSVGRGAGLSSSPNPSPLFIHVNHSHVTVGHEGRASSGNFVKREVKFAVCSNPRLQATDACRLGLTGSWVHVAVTRYQMFEGPATLPTSVKVSYKVMVNGEVLELLRYQVRPRADARYTLSGGLNYEAGESPIMDAPPFTSNDGSDLSLLFGAFRGGGVQPSQRSGPEVYFAGRMDEWRFWNGARTPSAIKSTMNQPLKPEKRQYYGDPSADRDLDRPTRQYKVNSVLMASWSFDTLCPPDNAFCPLPAVPAEYPAPDDTRVANKAAYHAVPAGAVTAAPTDNTGVMFYSEAGGVAVNPVTGEVTVSTTSTGLHQVLILLTFANGMLHVPVDFIVDVLDASCGGDVCTCTGQASSLPSLSMYAQAVSDPMYSGQDRRAMYVGNAVEADLLVADTTFAASVLYPGSLRTFAGFSMSAVFTGSKNIPASLTMETLRTKIGFSLGALKSGERMRFSTSQGQNPAHMEMRWLPCADDVGNHTVCADAVDLGLGAAGTQACGSSQAQALASTQKCLRVQVEPDPAPRFLTGEGLTPTAPIEAVMGRAVEMTVAAVDDNCMDTVSISIDEAAAPAGAALGAAERMVDAATGLAVPGPCAGVRRTLTWTPGYAQGGLSAELCVVAADTGGTGRCPGLGPKHTRHCVPVAVRRCEYALLFDQELQHIAGAFRTDWMRLWSLNPQLLHPDYIVYASPAATISVGHLMRVQPGEDAPGVARRMGMPLEQLQMLNHDIDVAQPLLHNQTLCVIPNSCAGSAGSSYRQRYAQPAFSRDAPPQDRKSVV